MPSKNNVTKASDQAPAWLEQMLTRHKNHRRKGVSIAWVGTDEQSDDSATSKFNREAVKEITDSSGDGDLLSEWQGRKVEIHCYPEIRSSSHRPRIIEITLRTQELRDKLLAHMKMGGLSLTKRCVHSYARKVHTRGELEYDRTLRKKAGLLNQQEGRLVYVVRDLSIHKLKNPCAFPRSNEKQNGNANPGSIRSVTCNSVAKPDYQVLLSQYAERLESPQHVLPRYSTRLSSQRHPPSGH
ncbi:hypothetical protein ANCDUO_11467 [Ancylostoma duodenale]|uniref:Uncharacterized protein n=1 Tax=Ancylostoma duodenale TaxID=51022 RepID=A0A0C2CNP4_9BILA|nr:hypothetical protein ANCDUO_11467 [Ancylostoma duodenale]